jgi:hypothetical protein
MFFKKILKNFFADSKILNSLILVFLNRFAVSNNVSCKNYCNLTSNLFSSHLGPLTDKEIKY